MESGDSCACLYLDIKNSLQITHSHVHVFIYCETESEHPCYVRVHCSPLCADVTVTFSPQNYTVTEGDPAPLMIILDKPAAKDITVAVTTMDITAEGDTIDNNCSLCTHL